MKYSLSAVLGLSAIATMTGCGDYRHREGVILSESHEEKLESYVLRVKHNAATNSLIVLKHYNRPSPNLSDLADALHEGDTILFYPHSIRPNGIMYVYTHHIKKMKKENDIAHLETQK